MDAFYLRVYWCNWLGARKNRHITSGVAFVKNMLFEGEPVSRAISGSYIFLLPTLQVFFGIMRGLFWFFPLFLRLSSDAFMTGLNSSPGHSRYIVQIMPGSVSSINCHCSKPSQLLSPFVGPGGYSCCQFTIPYPISFISGRNVKYKRVWLSESSLIVSLYESAVY